MPDKTAQRPTRKTHDLEQVGQTHKVKDVLNTMPASYLEAQRKNKKLRPCCQDPENLKYATFKTEPGLEKPNLAILECEKCGAKHYRAAGSTGENQS